MVDAQKALAAQYLQTSLPILSQVMALEIRKHKHKIEVLFAVVGQRRAQH